MPAFLQSFVLPDHDDGFQYGRFVDAIDIQADAQLAATAIVPANLDELPEFRGTARTSRTGCMCQRDDAGIPGDLAAQEENRYVEEFFAGADLVIYDAQYTQEEYNAARKGWGHTAIEYAIDAAKRNDVKRLALFHHDPERTDEQIDALAAAVRKVFENLDDLPVG